MFRKGALQISFGLLFAIVIGGFILVIAIYLASTIIGVGDRESTFRTARGFGALLNPLETGSEDAVSTSVSLPSRTRIHNECDDEGNFGEQGIRTSRESFGEFSETGGKVNFENRYLFSGEVVEGKKFFIFLKPLDFPFKVSDLIYLTSAEKVYCFYGLSGQADVKNDVPKLNQENLIVRDSGNCPDGSVRVCFGGGCGNADVKVTRDAAGKSGRVEKDGETLRFETDALMYAAIFSDKEIYECQLRRLVKRTRQLAAIYGEKSVLVSRRGCENDLNFYLSLLNNEMSNYKNSGDLRKIRSFVRDAEEGNDGAKCRLW